MNNHNTPRSVSMLAALLVSTLSATTAHAATAYVVNEVTQDISVVDTDTNTVLTTITGLLSPVGVTASADGKEIYVTTYLDFVGDDGVRIYDTATNLEIGEVNTGVDFNTLQVVASSDGNLLYASNESDDTVSVIDRATLQVVDTFTVGTGPIGLALTPSGDRLLVANSAGDDVSIVDAQTGALQATIPVGSFPNQVIMHPSGLTAYTTDISSNSVSAIYLPVPTVVATIAVGTTPVSLAIAPAGDEAWVVTAGTNDVQVMNLETNTIVDTVAVGNLPLGVTFTPDGKTALVTNATDNTVTVIDAASRTVVDTINVGQNPSDLVVVDPVAVGGETRRLTNQFALCQNRTTGQTAVIPLFGSPNWDCEAAGLLVSPGDSVQQIVRGTVTP